MPGENALLLTANIEGLAELDKALADLEVKTATKALRGAMMYATTPLVKDIKSNAPVLSGETKLSIKRRTKIDKKGRSKKNTAVLSVGTRLKGKANKKNHLKAHLLEKGGKRQRPHPFIRPAFDRNKNIIIDRFAERLKQNITKAGGL